MVKRKKAEGNESDGDQVIPIPIQTFLWRQTRLVHSAKGKGVGTGGRSGVGQLVDNRWVAGYPIPDAK